MKKEDKSRQEEADRGNFSRRPTTVVEPFDGPSNALLSAARDSNVGFNVADDWRANYIWIFSRPIACQWLSIFQRLPSSNLHRSKHRSTRGKRKWMMFSFLSFPPFRFVNSTPARKRKISNNSNNQSRKFGKLNFAFIYVEDKIFRESINIFLTKREKEKSMERIISTIYLFTHEFVDSEFPDQLFS